MPLPCAGEGLFWRRFEGIVRTNNSNVQNALMVGSIDPSRPVPAGAQSGLWAPQSEYWLAGPITFVNYGLSGGMKLCADVGARVALRKVNVNGGDCVVETVELLACGVVCALCTTAFPCCFVNSRGVYVYVCACLASRSVTLR